MNAFLDFLAPRAGHIPRVLGFDEQGREVLTFLPGRVVNIDTELLTPGQINSLVSWTRSFHELVADMGDAVSAARIRRIGSFFTDVPRGRAQAGMRHER